MVKTFSVSAEQRSLFVAGITVRRARARACVLERVSGRTGRNVIVEHFVDAIRAKTIIVIIF